MRECIFLILFFLIATVPMEAQLVVYPDEKVSVGLTASQHKLTVNGTGIFQQGSPQIILKRTSASSSGYIQGIHTQLSDGAGNWWFGNHNAIWKVAKTNYGGPSAFTIQYSSGSGFLSSLYGRIDLRNSSRTHSLYIKNEYGGTSRRYGIDNHILSNGTGGRTGIRNLIYQNTGDVGTVYSIYNDPRIVAPVPIYGMYNIIRGYSTSTGTRYGVYNYLLQSSSATGNMYGTYHYLRPHGSGTFYGSKTYIAAQSGATGTKFGYHASVANVGSGANYGVYSTINGGTGYAGYFVGDLYVSGTIVNPSDDKLKEDVKDISNALSKLNKVKPKTYKFKKMKDKPLPEKKQYGFIAQELQQIFPEMVHEVIDPDQTIPEEQEINHDSDEEIEPPKEGKVIAGESHLAVDYDAMIPVLVQAIKELHAEIEDLKKGNNAVDDAAPVEIPDQAFSEIKLEVAARLMPNEPNPAHNETRIKYRLPKKFSSATLDIYDMEGNMLKSHTLDHEGWGEVKVDLSAVPSGAYSYSLIVNGQLIDTKVMVIQ